jgi:hypothetical protein
MLDELRSQLDIMDYNSNIAFAKKEGANELNDLYSWLSDMERNDDIKRAYKDEAFRSKLMEEYNHTVMMI